MREAFSSVRFDETSIVFITVNNYVTIEAPLTSARRSHPILSNRFLLSVLRGAPSPTTTTNKQLVEIIRDIETKYMHPICILADLQGPKLRVGVFDKDSVRRRAGEFRREGGAFVLGKAYKYACMDHQAF